MIQEIVTGAEQSLHALILLIMFGGESNIPKPYNHKEVTVCQHEQIF